MSDLNIDEKLIVPVSTYAKATCTEAERGLESDGIVEIEIAGYIDAKAKRWCGGGAWGCATGANGWGKTGICLETELGAAHGEHVFVGGEGGVIVEEVAVIHRLALGVLGTSDAETGDFSHALTDLHTAELVVIALLVVSKCEASGEDLGLVISGNIANGAISTGLDHTNCGVGHVSQGSVNGV